MKHIFLLLFGLLASNTAAQRRCGASVHNPSKLQSEFAAASASASASNSFSLVPFKDRSYTINVYMHIITTEAKKHDYPGRMINAQIDALNVAFRSSRFTFKHVGTSRTVNPIWAADPQENGPSVLELEYTKKLKRGTYADLNVYALSDLKGLAGRADYPHKAPTLAIMQEDGVVLQAETMPGGRHPRYNQGKTLVHEVGHWLGLMHTFEGGSCEGPGDYVDDTTVGKVAYTGACERGINSCPNHVGSDDISNYMNYADDSCADHFTAGQGVNMRVQYGAMRLPYRKR